MICSQKFLEKHNLKGCVTSFFLGEQWLLTIQNNKYYLNPDLEISVEKQECFIE